MSRPRKAAAYSNTPRNQAAPHPEVSGAPLLCRETVHELAHLHELHHTPAFWSRVERVIPDYERRKTRLAENGMEYSRFEIVSCQLSVRVLVALVEENEHRKHGKGEADDQGVPEPPRARYGV